MKEELNADACPYAFKLLHDCSCGRRNASFNWLAARAASAIARTGASIQMINQGSSEVSLVFGVHKEDETKILKELYD